MLLIEAGPDFEPGGEPEAIRDRGVRTLMHRKFFWPELLVSDAGPPLQFMQAKLMGGGSSINSMHAQCSTRCDYDEWRQLGVEGWGWDDVLPYFKRHENDVDLDNDMHSKDGPVQVRRAPEDSWSGLTFVLRDALDKRGLARIDDANACGGDGTMPVPLSNTATDPRLGREFVPSLTKEVRARPASNSTAASGSKRAASSYVPAHCIPRHCCYSRARARPQSWRKRNVTIEHATVSSDADLLYAPDELATPFRPQSFRETTSRSVALSSCCSVMVSFR